MQKQLLCWKCQYQNHLPDCQCTIDYLECPTSRKYKNCAEESKSSGRAEQAKLQTKKIVVHDQLLDKFIYTLFIIHLKHSIRCVLIIIWLEQKRATARTPRRHFAIFSHFSFASQILCSNAMHISGLKNIWCVQEKKRYEKV